MTEKTEALRLADALDYGVYDAQMARVMDKAAAELRRLAAVEAQRDALLEALKWLDNWMSDKTIPECGWKVRAVIKAVKENT